MADRACVLQRAAVVGVVTLAALALLVLPASSAAQDSGLTPVTIQLRWDHQYQFAGYYAADWLGYYEDAGFDVDIRSAITEDGGILSAVEEVESGRAEFGIGSADILLARDRGVPIVVCASIFQHSAAAFYSLEGSGIQRPSDLVAVKVARNVDDLIDVELQALLHAEGIDVSDVPPYRHMPGFAHLVNGDVDVMPGYTLSLDYQFEEAGIAVETLRPIDYGIDFYGDSLFAHERLADADPQALDRFTEATMRGWVYAIENADEIADRISTDLPRTAEVAGGDLMALNRFQADVVVDLAVYPLVEIGNTSPERWSRMHTLLLETGAVSEPLDVDALVFDATEREAAAASSRLTVLLWVLGIGVTIGLLGAAWLVTLGRQVAKNTGETREAMHYTRALARIDQVLHSSLAFDEVSQLALEKGVAALGADSAVVSQYDGTGWLNLNSTGFDPSVAGMELTNDEVTNGVHAIETRQAVAVDDAYTDPRVDNEFMREWELRSAVAIPLIIRGEPAGAVFFNFLRDIHHFTPTEIDFVTKLTSSLALALANAQTVEGIEARVEERTRELQALNKELTIATEAKSDFLASMSHELRTPLNSIIGFSGLLAEGKVGELDQEQHRQVSMIHTSGRHLLELINEVLDLAKIEAGEMTFEFETVSVADMIDQVVAATSTMAHEKSLSLDVDIDPEVVEVLSSRLHLTQVLFNVVGNAVKYTDDGGVRLVVRRVDGAIRFAVSDTGRGIAESDMPHLFDEFFQASRNDIAKSEGTGLGLTVSKRLVEALGGTIEVASVLGEGSTFTISIPDR